MAQNDIVARLQLRAEQFSSETGKAFAEMKTRAQSAAQDVRSQFTSGFAEVQRLAQTALQVPRTASGGLDLSGQIAELRQSALAADDNAAALRQLSLAATEAANAERVDAQALRLRADAAAVGSLASEKAAQGYRDEIVALEAMQAELNRGAGGLTRIGSAHQLATVNAGAQRAAYQQLSFQLSDFTTQVAGGTSVFVAFSQQAGQAAGAIGLLAGESKGLIGFLGGPWTQVILAGISIVGLLATSHKSAADAEGDHAGAAGELKGALDRLSGSIAENNHATRQGIQDDLNAAVAKRDLARAALEQAKARVKADLATVPAIGAVGALGTGAGAAAAAGGVGADAVLAAQKIRVLDAELAGLGKNVRSGEIKLAMRDVEGSTDKAAAATHRYEDALDALQRRYTAAGNKLTPAQFRLQAEALVRTRDAALDAARAHDKHGKAANGSAKATREVAAAAREAAAAEKALASELDAVQAKFDPNAKAARDYAAELAKIADLREKGAITGDQAQLYSLRASQAEIKRQMDAAEEFQKGLPGQETGADMISGIMSGIEKAKPSIEELMEGAGTRGGEAFVNAASQIGSALGISLGGKGGGLLSGAFNLLNGRGSKLDESIDLFAGKVGELADSKLHLDPKAVKGLTDGIGGALKGAATGSAVNSVFAPLGKALGLKTSRTGAEIGGALGSLSGIPGGNIIGSIAGSIFGGLFKKEIIKKGSASVTGFSVDDVSFKGNAFKRDSLKQASAVQGGLLGIIDQLYGGEGSFAVSIGRRDKKFVVDETGAGRTKGAGTPSFKDSGDALAYAIRDAIKDGAITGISAASKAIFAKYSDLDTAIAKATLIESVPHDLKAMLDPVGSAIDDLNRKFQKVVDAMKEGGATAEQMAQAEQLHKLQLDQVKASTDSASQALKDFRGSLLSGSNSPLSLRDQETQARAVLQPFLDDIAAGKGINQGKYQDAAQGFLDIERSLYGSTDQYFAAFDKIQAATTRAIEKIDNAVPITAPVADPFVQATASATQATATSTQASAEILTQAVQQLASQNVTMKQILEALKGGSAFASGTVTRAFG